MLNHIIDFIKIIFYKNTDFKILSGIPRAQLLDAASSYNRSSENNMTSTIDVTSSLNAGVGHEKTDHGTPMLVLPTNSMEEFQNFLRQPENKNIVCKFVLNQLTKAIKNNLKYIELFRVGNTKYVARIEKIQYEDALTNLKKHFIQYEMYEDAEKCHKLIVKNKVNSIT